jgi:hypothetical protein
MQVFSGDRDCRHLATGTIAAPIHRGHNGALDGAPHNEIQAKSGLMKMNWLVGLLIIGAVSAGVSYDRRRRYERERLPRPDVNRWEDEGGAVPGAEGRTAAQTEPRAGYYGGH